MRAVASDRESEWMARGFWSELLLTDDDLEPMGGEALRIYRIGEKYGTRCRKIIGSSSKARALVRQTKALQSKAALAHSAIVRSIKRQKLPRHEEEKALRDARPEPCATCQFIAICAATAMTCGRFRGYTSRNGGWSTVPDKTWDESFQVDQEDG